MSSFLTLAYIIPVVAGNEKTHVDKPTKSTSSWLRTGLELLLGAGCVGGVIREFQNRNTIKSRDEDILKLKQKIEQTEKGLTTEQQQELKTLKALIDTVYGADYAKYLTITGENVVYNVNAIIKLANEKQLNLSQQNLDSDTNDGIVKTYITTKSPELKIPLDPDYATVHTIPPYDLCLLQLVDLETCLMLKLCDTINSKALEKTNKALLISNNTIK